MWQIRLDELDEGPVPPTGKYNRLTGITDWFCPLCGMVVGIESDGSVHDKGMIWMRARCKNGHAIKWEER